MDKSKYHIIQVGEKKYSRVGTSSIAKLVLREGFLVFIVG